MKQTFRDIRKTPTGDVSIGYSDDFIIKIEHEKHPWKLRSLIEEADIIKYLNSKGCVSCPKLVYDGITESGQNCFIQQRVYPKRPFNLADMVFSILEQKSFGVCQGDLKRENFIFDDICHIIDYDQAIFNEAYIKMGNLEFLETYNDWFVDRWKKFGFDFKNIYDFGGFDKDKVLGLFKDDSFNLAKTTVFKEQVTTNTDSGIYHDFRTDKVFIEGARSVNPRLEALDKIEFKKGEKVLDVGCNIGILSYYLCDRGCNVTGIDMDKNIILGAKMTSNILGKNIEFQYLDLDLHRIEEYYDTICLFSVIHHIANFYPAARNIAEKCDRIIIECRLWEQGSRPVNGKWTRASSWKFDNREDLVFFLETVFKGFEYTKSYGAVDRRREILEFIKKPIDISEL